MCYLTLLNIEAYDEIASGFVTLWEISIQVRDIICLITHMSKTRFWIWIGQIPVS